MATFDVSAVAREVLKLMRTDEAPTGDATAPAVSASAGQPPARRRRTKRSSGPSKAPPASVVERYGRKLARRFGGWFGAASEEPENEHIVAQACFTASDKGTCNVRVFNDGWAAIEFPSLSSYRQNALAVRPEVWACVMNVMRSTTCSEISTFLAEHGLRERV
jgi:hypothetical protein